MASPIKAILAVLAVLVFLVVVYKIVYEGGLTATVPDVETVKANIQSTRATCNVASLGQLVSYEGNPIVGSNVRCQDCLGYLSVTSSGSCKYIDDTCTIVGEAIPCPFN